MARSIIAVIVGYLAMFVLVFATFTCVFLFMGTDWSFKPNSFEASNRGIAMSLVANLVVGIVGGLICALIAKGSKAPMALAIVVFVLGLLLAIPSLMAHKRTPAKCARAMSLRWRQCRKQTNPFGFRSRFQLSARLGS